MYEFLSGYNLTRDIGSQYEYSNLGVGLLGPVLSLRAGMSYEALVRARLRTARSEGHPDHANSGNEGASRYRTQRRLGSGGKLGYPDVRGRRRATLHRTTC
jgi:hypothetical protein